MSKIIVPAAVVEGFVEIGSLDESQMDKLSQFIKSFPVGGKFDEI